MKIQITITGRSYHNAKDVPAELSVDHGATVDDALAAITDLLPAEQQLPASCLLAVSGEHLGTLGNHQARELQDGDELVLLAPVAGG